jgi:Ca-activated chloride channel family protein
MKPRGHSEGNIMKSRTFACALLCFVAAIAAPAAQEPSSSPQTPAPQGGTFRFRTGVDLINVTATVTDQDGRFVAGLERGDFLVFEDDRPQTITHFTAERVPVSLGIVLDTSGSMEGEKMLAARMALERFLFDLLGPEDEVFLYRFDNAPILVQEWTTDRQRIADQLRRIQPRGSTSLYDAVADAIPLAQSGRHRKKALVVISDGNDTNSRMDLQELKALIRETEVLVYAIGIDAQMDTSNPNRPWGGIFPQALGQRPVPRPFPIPGGRPTPGRPRPPIIPGRPGYPPRNPFPPRPPSNTIIRRGDERVNVAALRDITDDSGGRTEIIRSPRDLGPATAGIADELSRQYYIGYPAAAEKDGRWHSIRVEVRQPGYVVRARRGYVATQ